MTDDKLDLIQGTLDVMVLQTLSAMGPLHGYDRGENETSGPKRFRPHTHQTVKPAQ